MSKIEKYKAAQSIARNVRLSLFHALGLSDDGTRDPHNDKHMLRLEYTGDHAGAWSDAKCFLHASYGYYGSSSGYRAMSNNVAKYLVKALNRYISAAARDAIAMAESDAEVARLDAEDEAKAVLKEASR
jgi:CubicO group peptidase (beta-lactamase class C family)